MTNEPYAPPATPAASSPEPPKLRRWWVAGLLGLAAVGLLGQVYVGRAAKGIGGSRNRETGEIYWDQTGRTLDSRRNGGEMTLNKQTIEKYMDGFRRSDHEEILSCLTDDVEWMIPGAFHARGKDAFDKEIENESFVGSPEIVVTRMTEEADVVIAEGSVRTQRKDGTFMNLAFCDVFEMQGGKIRRLTSYLMETK